MSNNEFDNLLNYLDSHSVVSGAVVKKEEPIIDIVESKSYETKLDIPTSIAGASCFDVNKFENLMRNKLIEKHQAMVNYERPYISVTELLSCLRKSYYSRLKYPIDVKKLYRFSYLYLIQEVGNKVHEVVQNIYDFDEVEKTVIYEDYKVKGRVDGIKGGVVFDVKTVDNDKIPTKCNDSDYFQGAIYAQILNDVYKFNIHTISLVYVSRSLKKIAPFDAPFDKTISSVYLQYSKALLNAISKKLPPDPINATDVQCKYCEYKLHCQKDYVKKVEDPSSKKNDIVFLM